MHGLGVEMRDSGGRGGGDGEGPGDGAVGRLVRGRVLERRAHAELDARLVAAPDAALAVGLVVRRRARDPDRAAPAVVASAHGAAVHDDPGTGVDPPAVARQLAVGAAAGHGPAHAAARPDGRRAPPPRVAAAAAAAADAGRASAAAAAGVRTRARARPGAGSGAVPARRRDPAPGPAAPAATTAAAARPAAATAADRPAAAAASAAADAPPLDDARPGRRLRRLPVADRRRRAADAERVRLPAVGCRLAARRVELGAIAALVVVRGHAPPAAARHVRPVAGRLADDGRLPLVRPVGPRRRRRRRHVLVRRLAEPGRHLPRVAGVQHRLALLARARLADPGPLSAVAAVALGRPVGSARAPEAPVERVGRRVARRRDRQGRLERRRRRRLVQRRPGPLALSRTQRWRRRQVVALGRRRRQGAPHPVHAGRAGLERRQCAHERRCAARRPAWRDQDPLAPGRDGRRPHGQGARDCEVEAHRARGRAQGGRGRGASLSHSLLFLLGACS